MNGMVERVAVALAEDACESVNDHWRRLARTAIEAMLELSVDDINACHMEPTPNNLAYYRAMLAAALEEKP